MPVEEELRERDVRGQRGEDEGRKEAEDQEFERQLEDTAEPRKSASDANWASSPLSRAVLQEEGGAREAPVRIGDVHQEVMSRMQHSHELPDREESADDGKAGPEGVAPGREGVERAVEGLHVALTVVTVLAPEDVKLEHQEQQPSERNPKTADGDPVDLRQLEPEVRGPQSGKAGSGTAAAPPSLHEHFEEVDVLRDSEHVPLRLLVPCVSSRSN